MSTTEESSEFKATRSILSRYLTASELDLIFLRFQALDQKRSGYDSANWRAWPGFVLNRITTLKSPRDIFCNEQTSLYFYLVSMIKAAKMGCLSLMLSFRESDQWPSQRGRRILWRKPIARTEVDSVLEGEAIRKMFARQFDGRSPKVLLEIGSGYGRLAEYFVSRDESVKYVCVDASPLSIAFAYSYTARIYGPEAVELMPDGIGVFENFLKSSKRILIIGPKDIEQIPARALDALINVHSMDEMDADTLRSYLVEISRLQPNLIYLKNHFIRYRLGTKEPVAGLICICMGASLLHTGLMAVMLGVPGFNTAIGRMRLSLQEGRLMLIGMATVL